MYILIYINIYKYISTIYPSQSCATRQSKSHGGISQAPTNCGSRKQETCDETRYTSRELFLVFVRLVHLFPG